MQTILLPVQPIKKAHLNLEILLTILKIILTLAGYSPILALENQTEATNGSLQ